LVEDCAAAFEGGAGREKEEAGEEGGTGAVEAAGDGEDDAGCGERDSEGEESAGGFVIAEEAGYEREQKGVERRPMEIDVGIGTEGKIVLDGDEVGVEGTELVEGVGHGHATGAGPTLEVAVEAEVKEARVGDDEGERGDGKSEWDF
jgi:hypothetical protein